MTIAGSSLAGGTGADLTYPGASLDDNGNLIPQGSLSDNTVTITDGSIPGNAYGAATTDGDAVRNQISMTGGSITFLVGAHSETGSVERNSVLLEGGTVTRSVYGGESGSGNAQYNSVTMTGGSVTFLLGAYSGTGNVERNSVLLEGGTVTRSVYGGESGSGNAQYNSVTMTGGSVTFLLGAYSGTGNVERNSVLLEGGTVTRSVYGGESGSGNIQYNSVTMTGGTAQWVQGAYSDSGNVTGNQVSISGGTLSGGVIGGQTGSGDAISNSVQFGNTTATWLHGGYSSTGSASGNRVVITSGGVNNNAFGGYVDSGTGDACNNLFIMYGGEVGLNGEESDTGYLLAGGRASEGNAVGNRVILHGGRTDDIFGGFSANGGFAHGNHVLILGGTVESHVTGGMSMHGSSSGNVVEIRGGSVGGNIYGGRADSGTATHNTVILEGSYSLGQIYGGWNAYAFNPGETATDVTTGNTLILENFQGSAIYIRNFEHYVLRLSSWNGNGDPILTVSFGASSIAGPATDLSNSTFRLEIPGISTTAPGPAVGDSITLIRNDSGLITTGMILETPCVSFKRGIAMLYDAAVSVGDTTIDATITSSSLNPQLKSLSEGRIAAMALSNQGADLVAGLGISRAAMAAMQGGSLSGVETFLAMEGSHSSYSSGSHVDQDGYSVLAGVSTALSNNRSLVLGGFVESGWGSYTAHNSFADAPFVRASGDTSYYGGGLLARWDLTEYGLQGIALEASFRAGRLDADYYSGDLTDGAGNSSTYNLSSPYYGGHVGAAVARELGRKVSMEAYGRFLWTRQDDDHATISGDHIRFQDMNSSRLQGGARFHYAMTPTIRPYAGAAYEWQCNGTARAAAYGQDIGTPTLRGGTGIAEVGVIFQPAAGKPMFIDIGVKGYTGKREGISGNLQFRAAF